MSRTEAIERLERIVAAMKELPDEFSVLSVDLDISRLDSQPGLFVARNKFDGKDGTALAEYAQTVGYECREDSPNENAGCYYTDVYFPNGVIVHTLNRGAVIAND